MNALHNQFYSLLHFQNSIDKYPISKDDQDVLAKAFSILNIYQNNQSIALENASVLDQALEIKKKYEKLQIVTKEQKNQTQYQISKKTEQNYESLDFRGNTKEYFKIWIVNIFLTIITIGIYSAWAKVRTNRYFYANTFYKDSSFEYTANPISILKGRLIVFSIYVAFLISSQLFLNSYIAGTILIFAILMIPWIVNRAIKFKLKNIKHRNISFHYRENAPMFYKFFLIHLILNIVTIGLAYPYSLNKFKELLINNSQFGTTTFSYQGDTKGMYKQFLKVIGTYIGFVVVPIFMIGAFIFVILPSLAKTSSLMPLLPILVPIIVIISYIVFVAVGFAIKGIYSAYISNFVYNHTSLESITFQSTLKASKLAWIYVTNIFAIILSLGLLTPWAKVRLVRYKCENFAICATDVSNFIAVKQKDQTALGEEAEEFFDIDIGF